MSFGSEVNKDILNGNDADHYKLFPIKEYKNRARATAVFSFGGTGELRSRSVSLRSCSVFQRKYAGDRKENQGGGSCRNICTKR